MRRNGKATGARSAQADVSFALWVAETRLRILGNIREFGSEADRKAPYAAAELDFEFVMSQSLGNPEGSEPVTTANAGNADKPASADGKGKTTE